MWIARRDKPERIVPTLESMETWVETEGQRGPVKENVLTTDRGNADWAEIRHRTAGTPFPYLLAGLKKSTQPTADLDRAHEMSPIHTFY